ncbi:EF-P beta-lysylation protein EpmB [Pseudoteredinibacter isoporae]|uniref:L-lysine 2,3-aminomutase n=1 Tax=Pseudoteredinibacter isoporae TaxID=570281 RepID=A0A7X0JRR3_9GAMM|nr:EF-P beta-lysylation protein EpmB [Pseudoteredinibacter isoporae]MBB6521079.1 EF-P beta-lysylation protein EpmB [Pseudoteredinibacter isoporae]NHO86643.1 EF-P beta-lysylation protein EpmB [Pseudoteredinibacter isoporae]NIB24905.1 EF-P beta-lysylation protein EpmB [Pseudoteredinibacter isoporae]
MNTILPTLQLEPSPQSWQQALQDLIKKPSELAELLNLSPEQLSQEAAEQFEVRVTRHFASLMEPGNPNDPLLLQVLPGIAETIKAEGYSSEPLMESDQFNPRPGVIHKYKGRLLLMASNQCAINCRYCFRRHFPYQDHHLGRKQWLEAVDYIAQDHSLSEVILSGGDPLSQSDKQLSWLAEQLKDIPHIKRLRIHSRLPVVLPSRVDEKLLSWLNSEHLQTSMVLHINHPQEISTELRHACKRLKDADVRLFNQSVLLKGINDNSGILAELSEALFESHIQPYYLHQLDKVQGAAHFQVEDEDARRLYYELRAELPGYLVPLLTQEIPGKAAKTPIV